MVGIDLGGEAAMSAAVAIWETGRCEVWSAFPSLPKLATRAARDRQPYEAMGA